jgi:hypothetical protein
MGEFAQEAVPARSGDSEKMWSPKQGSWPMTCAVQVDPFVVFEYLERILLNATSQLTPSSWIAAVCCLVTFPRGI